MSSPTVRDVATHANVSIGTVSNVLNNPSKVTEATRLKVRTAIKVLGFKSKFIIKDGASHMKFLGVVLPFSNIPFFEEFTLGIEDTIAEVGLCALVGYSRDDAETEMKIVTLMVEAGFKGVIVAPVGLRSNNFEKFAEQFVRVGYISQTDELPDKCSLAIDQLRGGIIGLEYLQQLGHKNILWVSGPDSHYQSLQRLVGMAQAAKDLGVTLTTKKVLALDHLTGVQIAREIMEAGPLPDAIFTANDIMALAVINHFTAAGISVPGDISVLGYDNVSYVESGLIPLSTVSQTPYQLGTIVAKQMLVDLSAEPDHVHEHVIFQPHIVERASTQRRG